MDVSVSRRLKILLCAAWTFRPSRWQNCGKNSAIDTFKYGNAHKERVKAVDESFP